LHLSDLMQIWLHVSEIGSSVVAHSATLATHERVVARQAAGERVLHLGFGEAGLPVLPRAAHVLADAAGRNGYPPVAGTSEARAAAADWFTRRGIPTDPSQIVLAPGSKALLYALVASLPGDIVLPRPSWVSYAAQAALAGTPVITVPAPAAAGGVPEPTRLRDALAAARAAGRSPGTLLLTLPDNPTGTLAADDTVRQVCGIARDEGLAVVSDEIYRDLCWDGEVTSPAGVVPERAYVTSGLSKSLALGGWRIGFARFPADEAGERTRERVVGLASEVWSALPGPMQDVAAYALGDPPEVTHHVAASRRLHRIVTTAVFEVLSDAGAQCRPPAAAFYLYPGFAAARPVLARAGVTTGAELADHLLEHHGVGVVAGEAFGDHPEALRFRVATSLLHGRTDAERWTALDAADPLALPWIAEALDTLRTALGRLTS
jgi:aspartate aminotransferase